MFAGLPLRRSPGAVNTCRPSALSVRRRAAAAQRSAASTAWTTASVAQRRASAVNTPASQWLTEHTCRCREAAPRAVNAASDSFGKLKGECPCILDFKCGSPASPRSAHHSAPTKRLSSAASLVPFVIIGRDGQLDAAVDKVVGGIVGAARCRLCGLSPGWQDQPRSADDPVQGRRHARAVPADAGADRRQFLSVHHRGRRTLMAGTAPGERRTHSNRLSRPSPARLLQAAHLSSAAIAGAATSAVRACSAGRAGIRRPWDGSARHHAAPGSGRRWP